MDGIDTSGAIRRNSLKSILIVVAFPVVLPTILFLATLALTSFGGRPDALAVSQRTFVAALGVMIAVTLVWIPIGYFLNQWIVDRATDARLLSRAELRHVWEMLDRLSTRSGIRTPALRLIDTEVLNAYASGLTQGSYSVTLTRGLVEALEDDELEGVLAHELTHIIHQDVRLMVIAGVLVGTIPMVHDIAMKAFWAIVMGILSFYRAILTLLPMPGTKLLAELTYGGFYWVVRLIAYGIGLVATLTSLVLQFSLSRRREFMADAGAVELTGNAGALMSALRKIAGNATLDTPLSAVRAMCIENDDNGWFGLFATHPRIEDRISALAQWSPPKRAVDRAPPEVHGALLRAEPKTQREALLDASTVARYRALLSRGAPESLDIIGREHLYRRARETVENAPVQNPSIGAADVARARAHLEAAIEEIELGLSKRGRDSDDFAPERI